MVEKEVDFLGGGEVGVVVGKGGREQRKVGGGEGGEVFVVDFMLGKEAK